MEYYRSADGYSGRNSRMRSVYSAPAQGCESQGNLPVVTTRRTGSSQEETQLSVVSRTELHLMGDTWGDQVPVYTSDCVLYFVYE